MKLAVRSLLLLALLAASLLGFGADKKNAVPAKVVDAVFKTPKGAPGSAEGETQSQRFVYRVTNVSDPKLDAASPEAKQLSTSLQESYADDIIGEYIARLENDFGVTLNQSALNQVIGGGPANTSSPRDY